MVEIHQVFEMIWDGTANETDKPLPQYTEWRKHFCVLPRRIGKEWHWLRKAYVRNCFIDNVKEYGTLADVMTKPRDKLLMSSLVRARSYLGLRTTNENQPYASDF